MRISHEELKDLFKHFRWIDNIPEDQNKRDEICMEARAALLLEANMNSEMMPAFLRGKKGDKYSHKNQYKLARPMTIQIEVYDRYSPTGKSLKTQILRDFEYGSVNDIGTFWGLPQEKKDDNTYYLVRDQFDNPDEILVDTVQGKTAQTEFCKKYPSFYSICEEITPYGTPEEICRFWGCSAEPFGKLKVRNMRPDYIWRTASGIPAPEQEACPDPKYVQDQRNFPHLIPCQSPLLTDLFLNDNYQDDWYCQVFSFRNEYGEKIMKLVKVYDVDAQNKYLLPVTTWIRNNSISSQIFCVPYPSDKTPLFNLNWLLKPECKTVILCDSVELADTNEYNNSSHEIKFTSFICSPGKYDQVDWSPLRDKEIVILVSNHSGMDLASAALKARELREYLREELDFEPSLVVVPVDYGKNQPFVFHSVLDIVYRFKKIPSVKREKIMILETESEIEEFFRKAEDELNKLPNEWWLKDEVPSEVKRIVEEQNSRPQPIDYIMRPLLVRGEATMLYAQKSAGKSSLAYSIAARVVSQGFSAKPVALLKEKWWTVPKGCCKVLYLDFENKGEMDKKKKKFQDGYFPAGKEKECRANLIMEDCSSCGIDFSAQENHQKLLNMLEDAKNKGTKGKSVDLLVIDTYTSFVRTETPATPANFKDLINKIRDMGIAILIVHHANSANEARGFASKLDPFYLTLNLSCDPESPDGDLDEQPRIITYENPRDAMSAKLRAPFKVLFDNETKHWKGVDLRNENAELKLIVDGYKKQGFDRNAICQMLGLEKSALSDRLKKAEEIK